jgi:hypothetical protein
MLRSVLRVGLLLVLWSGLWGCALVNPGPPRAVVAQAVAQKVAQTQSVLQQSLNLPAEAQDFPQASGIHVTGHRWVTLRNQPTVKIDGTYHLKGGGLGWGQQRQNRPFSLYLRRAAEDQWIVVEPEI